MPLAARARDQAAPKRSDAQHADAADQPADQRIRAERRELDREHEDARPDDRPDDQREWSSTMPMRLRLAAVAHAVAPQPWQAAPPRPSPPPGYNRTGVAMRAFIFPGQGSQAVGMGAALAEASRTARDVFAEVDEALGQNLFRLMREGPEDELKLTENAQPAIMAHSLAVFRALTSDGGVDLAKAAQLRRRPQPRRIFGACARRARSTLRPPPSCSSCAARRCRRRCRSARARWRRCSAPTSTLAQQIADAAAARRGVHRRQRQ